MLDRTFWTGEGDSDPAIHGAFEWRKLWRMRCLKK